MTDLIQSLTRAFLISDGYDPDTEMADPHPAGMVQGHYRPLAEVAVKTLEEGYSVVIENLTSSLKAHREALSAVDAALCEMIPDPAVFDEPQWTPQEYADAAREALDKLREVLSRFDEGKG